MVSLAGGDSFPHSELLGKHLLCAQGSPRRGTHWEPGRQSPPPGPMLEVGAEEREGAWGGGPGRRSTGRCGVTGGVRTESCREEHQVERKVAQAAASSGGEAVVSPRSTRGG